MGITAYHEYFDFNQTGSDPMKIERINENRIFTSIIYYILFSFCNRMREIY